MKTKKIGRIENRQENCSEKLKFSSRKSFFFNYLKTKELNMSAENPRKNRQNLSIFQKQDEVKTTGI